MRKKRILLVDDEPDFLEVMGVRLEKWDYEIIKAHNGNEAVEALIKNNPDLIILDYMMPGLDGVATLEQIRKINNKIPVVMFTAYPDKKVMAGADKLGISAFIPKLSAFSDVQASLKAALDLIEKEAQRKE